ncbi:hypothetical protein EJB05_14603, partial [Eragrostis curvula]
MRPSSLPSNVGHLLDLWFIRSSVPAHRKRKMTPAGQGRSERARAAELAVAGGRARDRRIRRGKLLRSPTENQNDSVWEHEGSIYPGFVRKYCKKTGKEGGATSDHCLAGYSRSTVILYCLVYIPAQQSGLDSNLPGAKMDNGGVAAAGPVLF